MEKRRVVVTGIGTVNPIGLNAAETWANARAGVCGIGPITQFDATNFKVKLAGEVKNFNPEPVIDRRDAKKMARFTQLAVVAAMEALNDSGLTFEHDSPELERYGVIISSGIGSLPTIEEEHSRGLQRGFEKVSPFFIPMVIPNMAAAQIAIRTGFKGICTCPVTACAGGTNAVGDAFHRIRDGYEDVMIAGGTEGCVSELAIGGFSSMKALTTCADPDAASVPFDARRSGFVLGEGSGILVLEELEHAKARGAHIYAEFLGYGATCDAYHITSPAEDGSGAAMAMSYAIKDAGLEPEDIDYINAHGTGTPLNDLFETRAIKLCFGEHARELKINSTKSMTGHLLGAAGGIEAVVLTKSVEEDYVHVTRNLRESEEELDLDYCRGEGCHTKVDAGLSNSLGFGGHNATIVIGKYKD